MSKKNKASKLSANAVASIIEAVAATVTGVVTVETPMDSNVDATLPVANEVKEVTVYNAPTLQESDALANAADARIDAAITASEVLTQCDCEAKTMYGVECQCDIAPATVDAPIVTVTTTPVAEGATNNTTPTDAVTTPAQKAMYALAAQRMTLPVEGSNDEAPVSIANKRALVMACVYVACQYYECTPRDMKGIAKVLASKLFVCAGGGHCASKGRALLGEISVQGAKGYVDGYALHSVHGGKNADASKRHARGGDKHHETVAHTPMVKGAARKFAKLLGLDVAKLA